MRGHIGLAALLSGHLDDLLEGDVLVALVPNHHHRTLGLANDLLGDRSEQEAQARGVHRLTDPDTRRSVGRGQGADAPPGGAPPLAPVSC